MLILTLSPSTDNGVAQRSWNVDRTDFRRLGNGKSKSVALTPGRGFAGREKLIDDLFSPRFLGHFAVQSPVSPGVADNAVQDSVAN